MCYYSAMLDTEEEVTNDKRPVLVAFLPTAITLGNLICGFTAILLAGMSGVSGDPKSMSYLEIGALLIYVGMICDGLDGRVARMTNSTSRLGAALDSKADIVTFGVAPAILALKMARAEVSIPLMDEVGLASNYGQVLGRLAVAAACVYVACAALRLARFEAEDISDQPLHAFHGLPTPGAGAAIASLVLLVGLTRGSGSWIQQPLVHITLLVLTVVFLGALGLAMISRLPYAHIMNQYGSRRQSFVKVALGIMALIIGAFFWRYSLVLLFLGYALSAPFGVVWTHLRRKKLVADTLS